MLSRLMALSLSMTVACSGPKSSDNELKGHYENEQNKELANYEKYIGKQSLVPEYKDGVKQVFINADLVIPNVFNSSETKGLAKAIINAGSELVILTDDERAAAGLDNSDFDSLRDEVGYWFMDKVLLKSMGKLGVDSLWTRDYFPLMPIDGSGKPLLVDFNYYTHDILGEETPRILERQTGLPRVSLPIYAEGGNIIVNDDGLCLMSESVLVENSKAKMPTDSVLSKAEITRLYKQYVGCKDVKYFPIMPYEGSQHIDIWAKFISNDTILVHDLEDRAVQTMNPQYRSRGEEIQDYLKARQADLKALGLNVKKIPMPAPYFDVGNEGSDYEYEMISILSFINGLIVNGTIIFPDYILNTDADNNVIDLSDIQYFSDYKESIASTVGSEGFKAVFINSDNIVGLGGAIHCVTKESRVRLFVD